MRKRKSGSSQYPALTSSAFKLWAIAFTAPQVIAHRTARMMAAGPAPNARDRREFSRMGQEKVAAAGESLAAMALPLLQMNQALAADAMRQWWKFWSVAMTATGTPNVRATKLQHALLRGLATSASNRKAGNAMAQAMDRGLQPIVRRVTANAKRLRRG